jgi:hypothetical protein
MLAFAALKPSNRDSSWSLDLFIEMRLKKGQINKKLAGSVGNTPINYKAIYKAPVLNKKTLAQLFMKPQRVDFASARNR